MQFWLYGGMGAGASGDAGAGSYCFWFYGGMQSPSSSESVSPANFYFQFLTTG